MDATVFRLSLTEARGLRPGSPVNQKYATIIVASKRTVVLPSLAREDDMESERSADEAPRRDVSLVDDFLRQARRRPGAIAVQDGRNRWTYGELLARSVAIARLLDRQPRARHRRALLLAGKTCHSAPAILGTLMAGWTYACVDEGYPLSLVEGACALIRPDLVLVANEAGEFAAEIVRSLTRTLPTVDVASVTEGAYPGMELSTELGLPLGRGADIAYIGFTSGSTGRPKAVAMSHRAFLYSISRHIDDFGFDQRDRVAVQSGFAFDPAVMDLFSALMVGGTAVMVPTGLYQDVLEWRNHLQRHGVTSLMCVPGALEIGLEALRIGEKFAPLRRLVFTGDIVRPHLLRLLQRCLLPRTNIFNAFGLTEAPYILSGRIDPSIAATANGFEIPERDRHVRLDPEPDQSNDIGPVGLVLRTRRAGALFRLCDIRTSVQPSA